MEKDGQQYASLYAHCARGMVEIETKMKLLTIPPTSPDPKLKDKNIFNRKHFITPTSTPNKKGRKIKIHQNETVKTSFFFGVSVSIEKICNVSS